MSELEQSVISCPRCGTPLIIGHLKDQGKVVVVESLRSLESSPLDAWICPACGHVELQATHPECLAYNDIPDKDLGAGRDEWKDWEDDL